MDNLRNISLEHDEVVILFDATSQYSNVSVKEAIFEAAEKLYSGKSVISPVDKETLIILTKLATTNALLLTHDGTYCQIGGLSHIWLSKFTLYSR